MGPRLRVARLRTWSPVAEIPTKLSTFEHAPTTEYSRNHTSAVQSRVCSPDVVPVEILGRAFLLFTGATLEHSMFVEIDVSIVWNNKRVPTHSFSFAECIAMLRNNFKIGGIQEQLQRRVQTIFTFILIVDDLDVIKRNW